MDKPLNPRTCFSEEDKIVYDQLVEEFFELMKLRFRQPLNEEEMKDYSSKITLLEEKQTALYLKYGI